jgi:hypothetical protein
MDKISKVDTLAKGELIGQSPFPFLMGWHITAILNVGNLPSVTHVMLYEFDNSGTLNYIQNVDMFRYSDIADTEYHNTPK